MSRAVVPMRGLLGAGVVVLALGLSVVAFRLLFDATAAQSLAAASAGVPTHGAGERAQATVLRFAASHEPVPARAVGTAQPSASPRPAAAPTRKTTAAPVAVTRPKSAYPRLTWWSTGSYVTTVQRILGLPQTGVFGRRTHPAVVRFQIAHHIAPADGVVGDATWSVLRRVKPAGPVDTATPTPVAAATPAPVVTATTDPTMTATMRSSRAARAALGLAVWQSSVHGKTIAQRESGGRCTAVSPGGAYRGKWQVSATFWKGNGGTAFAASADLATCAQQDLVAYRGWVTSWWMPWGG